jgi:RHS repeat-associated protein
VIIRVAVATVLFVRIGLAPDAHATCTAGVSLSQTPPGQLTITATSTGACGWSRVIVDRDGGSAYVGDGVCNTSSTCTIPFTIDTTCLTAGSHTVRVRAECEKIFPDGSCDRDEVGTNETSFSLTTVPTVMLTHTDAQQNGVFNINMAWDFVSGLPIGGRLSIACPSVNASLLDIAAPSKAGTVSAVFDARCRPPGTYSIIGTAAGCSGPPADHVGQDQFTITIDPKPTVDLAPEASGPHRLRIHYNFPFTSGPPYGSLSVRSKLHPATIVAGPYNAPDRMGDWVADIACLPDADVIEAVSTSCHGTVTSDPVVNPACDLSCASGGGSSGGGAAYAQLTQQARAGGSSCDRCAGKPVQVTTGSMEYLDADPIAGSVIAPLRRTYQSQNQASGIFGPGWITFLDARAFGMDGSNGRDAVLLKLEDGRRYLFRLTGGMYQQIYPSGDPAAGILEYVSTAGVFRYRSGGGAVVREFNASSGLPVSIAYPGSDAVLVNYTSGKPAGVSDSRGRWAWTLSYGTSTYVQSIAVANHSDLTWTYGYVNGHLTSVTAPSGDLWRTYVYGTRGLEAAYGAAGELLESHAYDASGRATTSSAPDEEITAITFNQAGRVIGELKTHVATADGKTIDYYSRLVAGRMRTVEIDGSCNCASEDSVFVQDASGYPIREQNPRGYVTERTYLNGRVHSIITLLRPSGCDPETDVSFCRMTPDALQSASLVATSSSITTTVTYGDATWPDRPTLVTVDSLRSGQQRRETIAYDAVTGIVTAHTIFGYDPTAATTVEIARTTVSSLYNGTEAAAFDPCAGFSGPCAFLPAWVALSQPAGQLRRTDGPRADVDDFTDYVYYPFSNGVPLDAQGRLAAIKNAAGHVSRFEDYDAFGNPRRRIDPNGVVSETTYDTMGRLLTSTLKAVAGCDTAADALCAADIVTRRLYTSGAGPLGIEIGPRGEAVTYGYDSRGRTISMMRGELLGAVPSTAQAAIAAATWKEKIEYGYSSVTGHKTTESFFGKAGSSWLQSKTTSFTYDTSGFLGSIVHADGATIGYTYDRGQVHSVKDENHTTANTVYSYDGSGRLCEVRQALASASGGYVTTTYSYDRNGDLASVTDPNGNVTTYVYDDFGQMLSQNSPVTGITSYSYDISGNLVWTADGNGATTERTYDALHRVLTATSRCLGAETEEVDWGYEDTPSDAYHVGRVASMVDSDSTVEYAYDRRGLIRQENLSIWGESFVQSYGYDAAGNRTMIGYPSGRLLTYEYDFAGRQVAATGTVEESTTAYVTSASYLPFGPLASLAFGNGAVETRTFDQRYRPAAIQLAASGTTLASYEYGADPAGNLTEITDVLNGGYNRTFAYDDLNRLVTANSGTALWGAGGYTYDSMGNMLTSTLGASARSFTYEGTTSRVQTATSGSVVTEMQYDGAGNEQNGPASFDLSYTDTRTYSARNLLREIAITTGHCAVPIQGELCTHYVTSTHTIENGYDGRGLRVAGTVGNFAPVFFFYTPELRPLNASPHFGASLDVIWFGDRPVADDDPYSPSARFTFTDHSGAPILQMDAAAQVIWRAEYEPFGNVYSMRTGESQDQPLRFPGQQVAFRDGNGNEESYNIFRWYRSGWGRYTQSDPLGLVAGANLYAYVDGNPLNYSDPLGLIKPVPTSKQKWRLCRGAEEQRCQASCKYGMESC